MILLTQGWNIWLLGKEKEDYFGRQLGEVAVRCNNFIGHTNLAETIDLLSLADVVLTNHSGLMYVAMGLQRRVVVVGDSSCLKTTVNNRSEFRFFSLDSTPEMILSELGVV